MSKKGGKKESIRKSSEKKDKKDKLTIKPAKEISRGDFILVDFVGKVKETNEMFDVTMEDAAKKGNVYNEKINYSPRLVIVGEGWVVPGLDEELGKMRIGQEKTIEIPPEKAFGERDPKAIQVKPLREFKKQKIKPYPGMRLRIGSKSAVIKSVGSGRVTIDLNRPLAGKTLIYNIAIKQKLDEVLDKVRALIDWRIENPEILKEFKINISTSKIEIEIPEKAFLSEGLQYAKRGISRDIYKYIPKINLVYFIEKYQKESNVSSN
jgi:peptidylprolyl isomerase